MSRTPDKPTGSERIAHVGEAQIGRAVRVGGVWSVLQILLRNGVSIGTTAILARLLSADDYGLTGMVATLTAALMVFANMGLSWATIQRRDLTEAQVSNLFWLNVMIGFALWAVAALLSPLVAGFYGRPELVAIILVMGVSFAISGVAVQPVALMTRAMRFRALALIEVLTPVPGAVVAVAVAGAGGGYWALVAMGIVTQLTRTLAVLFASNWRPRRLARGVGTREMVVFGGLLAVNGVLIYVSRHFDSILIGRVWGAEALGYYDRAYFLMLLPSMLANGVLTNLMVPSLSAFQHDMDRFARAYRRAVRLVAYFGMPMAVGLALTAAPAVRLVYGDGWMPVVPLLMWLSIAAVTQPVYNTTGWLFTASGQARAYLWLTAVNTVVLGGVFLLTVPYGILVLAAGYGITMGLVIPLPALWYAHRVARIPLWATLRTLAPVAGLNLGMALCVVGAKVGAERAGLSEGATFAAQVVTGVAVYAALTPFVLREMFYGDVVAMLHLGKMG